MPKTNAKIFKNCFGNNHQRRPSLRLLIPKRMIAIVLVFSIFVCSQAIAQQSSLTADQILSNIEKKYAGKSFIARFTQISRMAALELTDKASGMAFFSHPGNMRWEYKTPEAYQIITNGRSIWIFRPEENQVMTGDASQYFKPGAGGAFLSDITSIRSHFDIRIKEESPTYYELDLVNKNKEKDLDSIVIRVAKKTFEIIRAVTRNPYDDTNLFEFFNTEFKSIDPKKFEFKIPAGASQIEME